MARRVAELDYRTTGLDRETPRVRTLTQALADQQRQVRALQPAFAAAHQGTGLLGNVSQASASRIALMTGALGPLGAGLAGIATRAPAAANGLLAVTAAQERMGLVSRVTNAAVLGGAAALTTAGVAGAAYFGQILRGADAYAALTARLRIFSDGVVSAAQNERALYESAREARTSVESLSTLFVRITPAISDMGRAQADALQVTELTSKALAIQGATAQEAVASTIQFSQALASGVLRGDELRSMLESSPLLLRYIAQNLELNGQIGVAFGQLRALGGEGQLTAERLIDALLRAAPAIEKDFIDAPKTAQQGWQVLRDTITRTVGQLSQTSGLQQGVFSFLDDLARRLDAFRNEALLNPGAVEPARRAVELLGGALDTAGQLAGGVAEHFDLIVAAAQALIALKAGEVLAAGFALAATKAREAYTAVQSFRANGVFIAGAAMDEIGGAAAINARAAATAAEAKALDLKVQAEVRARTAVAARAAADAAAAEAATLKASSDVRATVATEAQARASALATAAERAETAAKTAATSATNAQAAASTRLAIAQQAELAVTTQVNNAQAVKAAIGRGLAGVYGLLGGGIGVLTIALGGLIYATWRANQAWQDKVSAMRDAVVASDELRAISDQLASATWSEIPALQAAAAAHREKAAAALEDARASLQAAKASAARNAANVGRGSPYPGSGSIMDPTAEVRARDLQAVVAEGERDLWKANQEQFVLDWRARQLQVRQLEEQNRTGRNLSGGALSADQRAANTQMIDSVRRSAASEQARLAGWVAGAESTLAQNPNSTAHADVVSALRRSWEAVAAFAGGGSGGAPPAPTPSGGGKSAKMSAEDRQTLSTLERVRDAAQISQLMGRTPSSDGRFSVRDGQLYSGGDLFSARSEDEARAAAAYLEQIRAITGAKADLVAETGLTREALAAQAAETLATALATSQAAQADQRWQEKMAEARGESTAVAQAEREVADARRQGASITDEAADAYVRLVRAQEAARRSQEALNAVRPVVQDVVRTELADMGRTPERWRSDVGGMGFDVDAALAQWASARERIAAEVERRIRAEQAQSVADGLKSQEQADRDTAERIAAARVALNAENAEQIADIWRRQRDDDEAAWRERFQQRLDQERELADSLTGALEDLAMGADPSDIGRRFGEDLLRSIWEELVGNPLNLAIRTALRGMMSGDGTGGLWGSVTGVISNVLSGGFGGGAGGPAADLNGLYRDGGLPGFDAGGLPRRRLGPGLIRGAGGPRDDRIAAWVSNQEFISNARATAENLPLLEALNRGLSLRDILGLGRPGFGAGFAPGFAKGGLPGTSTGDLIARDVLSGDLGYVYAPRDGDAERDRQAAERRGDAGSGDLTVNFYNQSSQSLEATKTKRPDGGFDLIVRDAVRGEIKKSGADGTLAKALGQTPPKRRR